MDKPLSDINKNGDGKQDEVQSQPPASASPVPDSTNSKPGHHDFIGAGDSKAIMGSEIDTDTQKSYYNSELSAKSWDKAKENHRWDSSPLGRAGIRLFSRGGLGAAAFVAGGYYVTKGGGMSGYRPEMALSEIEGIKPLQYVAKTIDSVIAPTIKYTAKFLGASEQSAESYIRFRPTRYINWDKEGNVASVGRSLGHEAVNITFDFFSASIADAAGRDIANLADPHVKHSWKDDKGNVDTGKAAKALGKTLWRYVSYNGGEDWFAAVPYAYYMKGQRKVINKLYPGFEMDFDRGLNGGSFKVNKEGNITGNYLTAGMLDLQGRFSAYNNLTLMGRELYQYAGDRFEGKDAVLYGEIGDKHHKDHGLLNGVENFAKWVARSTVKSYIYMTPAVPFFSVFRSSQSKSKGAFIDPEQNAVLGYRKPTENGRKFEVLHGDELVYSYGQNPANLPPVKFYQADAEYRFGSINGEMKNHPLSSGNFHPYKQGEGSPILNAIGNVQYKTKNYAQKLPGALGLSKLGKRDMENYMNAVWGYTPYMYAKGETALLFDNGKMDASEERMIDGAANFDWKEFKDGANEVWRSVLHKPLKDPKREAYAMKRIAEDSSAADSLTSDQAYYDAVSDIADSPLSWKQRIIQGQPVDKPMKEKMHSSHAEQEAMRKALQELQPPTNSIH